MDSEPSSSPPPASPAGPSLGDIPRSIMISGIGAIVLILSVFFTWYTVSVHVNLGNFGGVGGSQGFSGHEATDIAWLVFLLGIVALAGWIVELYVPTVELPVPAWQIALVTGAVSVLLVLFRIISKPGGFSSSVAGVDVSLSWGIFVALLAAIAVTAGAYMRMQESQGGV